jgi:tripartite-type tricarboxylate transporter receptor subunit TctC
VPAKSQLEGVIMFRVRVHEIFNSVAVVLTISFVTVGSAAAQSGKAADFYRSKQLRFISGYSAGGLFNTATRIMARHAGKFIPGNQTCGSIT